MTCEQRSAVMVRLAPTMSHRPASSPGMSWPYPTTVASTFGIPILAATALTVSGAIPVRLPSGLSLLHGMLSAMPIFRTPWLLTLASVPWAAADRTRTVTTVAPIAANTSRRDHKWLITLSSMITASMAAFGSSLPFCPDTRPRNMPAATTCDRSGCRRGPTFSSDEQASATAPVLDCFLISAEDPPPLAIIWLLPSTIRAAIRSDGRKRCRARFG